MRNLFLVWLLFFAASMFAAPQRSYSPDEAAIRMAIYERHIVKSAEVWFVSEEEKFTTEMQRQKPECHVRPASHSHYDEKKKRPVDIQTGEPGIVLEIRGVSIQGESANAGFSWYSAPLGAAWISVKLKKLDGRWIIVEWRYDAIS